MHAILITFRPQAPEEEVMQELGPIMHNMVPSSPGLIMKTFVSPDPQTWGGFYLFASKDNADAFLDGELCKWLDASPLASDAEIRRFDVEEEHSIAFGTPSVPLADKHAA
jgi:hypothetical protein